MNIPFIDIRARLAAERGDILRSIAGVLDSGMFCCGPEVKRFEEEFAAYCGTRHAVCTGSGTEALWLALLASGIGPGDEVVTVSMTYAATAEAIRMTGADPVFVDIDEDTLTMDPAALAGALTARSKAVVPVHLHGRMADMDAIMEISRKHGLCLIEDSAQAHGAERHGRKAGSFGDAGCFSFYPSKNLGAIGDGGAVVTDRDDLATRLRMLRNHGQAAKNHHLLVGWNSRMDDIQAAVLRIGLKRLDRDNETRRQIARRYNEALAGTPGVVCPSGSGSPEHVHHIHAIRVRDQRQVIGQLTARGIGCAVHYPVPVHLQPAFAGSRHPRGSLPVTEKLAAEMVSLPIFPELTTDRIDHVVQSVKVASRASVAA
ncbi:MAG TPA: DegT/DnrJ/EryC1/StrS family aminotransferase [Luteolibacter sp.]|nr:DegT/DnrJ/EryC1/StrS family aminotransferase [Luteolibacter sp.]